MAKSSVQYRQDTHTPTGGDGFNLNNLSNDFAVHQEALCLTSRQDSTNVITVGRPVTRPRRVEGMFTQRPPPQIVAYRPPALHSSEHGAQLGIRLKAHIGDGQLRPYQGKAVFELLKLFPVYFAVRCYPFQFCCHGRRPFWLCVQSVFPHCVGTMFPLPGSCSADPFPMYAALPRSESYGSVRLPTARHARLALRTLAPPLPVQLGGCIGSRRLSRGSLSYGSGSTSGTWAKAASYFVRLPRCARSSR
jgi:hypothetical protein